MRWTVLWCRCPKSRFDLVMASKAPRPLLRLWRGLSRGVGLAVGIWLAGQGGVAAEVVSVRDGAHEARFEAPTHRYGHAIMGDLPEWGRLCLQGPDRSACVTLPETSVFEDIAPRLYDVDSDDVPEAVVVESSFAAGAALVVYKLAGDTLVRIATPPIGTRNRWLAPAGIGDLDGDGAVEIAFVDRPHLAKRLRIWRFQNGALTHVADASGLTNHRIGEPFITGGLRDCGGGPEIITADATWSRVMTSRLSGGRIASRDLGPFSADAVQAAMACR